MKKSVIDLIFEDYCQTKEYAELSVTPEIRKAEKTVLAAMGGTNEHDELLIELTRRIEDRLFALGFQYGVRFMCECMGAAPEGKDERSKTMETLPQVRVLNDEHKIKPEAEHHTAASKEAYLRYILALAGQIKSEKTLRRIYHYAQAHWAKETE